MPDPIYTLGECAWTARDLYPQNVPNVPHGDRAAAHHLVTRLYQLDPTLRSQDIADLTGYGRSYVRDLVVDPDGSMAKARKVRYAGTCIDCGGPTSGSEGRKPGRRCITCLRAHLHTNRHWTHERIRASFIAAARFLGRSPTTTDAMAKNDNRVRDKLSPKRCQEIDRFWAAIGDGQFEFPTVNTVQHEYGSWEAALDAAGLPHNHTGGPAHRTRDTYEPAPLPDHVYAPDKPEKPAVRRNQYAEAIDRLVAQLNARTLPLPADAQWVEQVYGNLADAHLRALETLHETHGVNR